MMKAKLLLIFLVLCRLAFAQDTVVNWLTFDQVSEKFSKKQKPILIFIRSDTSRLTVRMLSETFGNPEVARYINVLFYPILFDPKTSDSITFFNGQIFVKQPGQEYNQLLYSLLGNVIKFPAMVVFNHFGQGRVFYGFKDRDHIFPILVYYAEKAYQSVDYETFEKYYLKTYPPGKKQIITRLNIHWLTMQEALEKQKTQPRKIFIDLYDNYNISQTIMRITTYNNPVIAKYLNTHFYPVTVYARSDEEFDIKGIHYKKSEKYPYNTFVIDILNGKMHFPAFVILDENLNLLERVQMYMPPEKIEPLLHYYGDNIYKSEKYPQFLKDFKGSEFD